MTGLLRRLRRLVDWRAAAVEEWEHRRGAEAMLSRHTETVTVAIEVDTTAFDESMDQLRSAVHGLAADRFDAFARDLGRGPSPLRQRDRIQGDTWEGL